MGSVSPVTNVTRNASIQPPVTTNPRSIEESASSSRVKAESIPRAALPKMEDEGATRMAKTLASLTIAGSSRGSIIDLKA